MSNIKKIKKSQIIIALLKGICYIVNNLNRHRRLNSEQGETT